jgi:hypothetical protein
LFSGFILACLCAGAAFSLDFGGNLSQNLGLENASADGSHVGFSGATKITPWMSAVLPNNLYLYLSAGFSLQYETDQDVVPVFDLERSELTWQPRPNIFLEAGRFTYSDPLGYVASGLFDGAAASLGLGKTRLSLGAFYTGLLYKKTAEITMTAADAFDYADADQYWAPSRAVFSAVYTVPGLFSWKDTLTAGFIGQFDFRDEKASRLNTQYGMLQYLISPLDSLHLNLGGVLEFAEREGAEPGFGYLLTLRGDWELPTKMNDQFSLRFRHASGLADNNDNQAAFTPITGISQSSVFNARLSGLMALSMVFTLSPLAELSIVKETNLLMRTDLATFSTEGINPDSKSHALGMEIFVSLVWVPLSDVGLTFGGGVFLPFPEGAFYGDAPPKWKCSLGLVFSF